MTSSDHNRIQPMLDEHNRLVALANEGIEAGDEAKFQTLTDQAAQLVDDASAMAPNNAAEARTQLELIVEGERKNGLDLDQDKQMPTLARIVDVLNAEASEDHSAQPEGHAEGENRVQPLLEEWRRLQARWPVPTDEESNALGDAQDEVFNQAMATEPATVDELRAQLELAALDGSVFHAPAHLVEVLARGATFLREVG